MCSMRLGRNNPYTKIPKTKHEMKYGHVHYKALVAVVEIIRDHGGHVNWSEVSERTGISRFTLGRHFRLDPRNELRLAIAGMLDNVDNWLETQGRLIPKTDSGYNELILRALFKLMYQGGEFFSVACSEYRHEGVIYRVAMKLFLHLNFDWLPHGVPAPDVHSERAGMCIRMMEEVILRWGRETNCDKNKADLYIARMQRIIKAAEENKLP